MTGDGISKTIMAITTGHIVSAVHGTGADITVHFTVHGDIVLIGTDGGSAIGAATDISTHGIITHIITVPAGTLEEAGMTLGTMVAIMDGMILGTMEATTAGITLGRFTCTTVGTTHTITIMAQDI